ncbi:transcription initiation factor TFIID subunit 4-like isoform X5 [Bombus pyrosoma]|uniref:transcription initiation factor TFIID subunit 4-like isoform X5 n=1 Tax=Bombus pyrosoma TaxID=396416 RepID=UPI001CB92035|nr:transcription initiation factor TFIID subunit 4-like isoform X5 [Bombus pyrosoma]
MASAKFLEEALSTDVDESAVNAIVGSLETQLVTSTPAVSGHQVSSASVSQQNHQVNSGISNGGTITAVQPQKHGVSNGGGATTVNSLMNQEVTKPITTSTLLPVNVVTSNTVAPQVTTQQQQQHTQSAVPPAAYINQATTNQVTCNQTTNIPSLTKTHEPVKIIYPTVGQVIATTGVANANNKLSFPAQTVGQLANGTLGITSPAVLQTASNVSNVGSVSETGSQTVASVNKSTGTALVIKTSVAPSGMVSVPMSVPVSVAGNAVSTALQGKAGVTSTIVPSNVQILNVNAMRPGTPVTGQQAGKQVAPRVVIGQHMLGTRPGGPGITLQTLHGLQPGTQGHILLKTETGQFQLLRVGPAPTAGTPGGTAVTPNSIAGNAVVAAPSPGTTYRLASVPATVAATITTATTTPSTVTAAASSTPTPPVTTVQTVQTSTPQNQLRPTVAVTTATIPVTAVTPTTQVRVMAPLPAATTTVPRPVQPVQQRLIRPVTTAVRSPAPYTVKSTAAITGIRPTVPTVQKPPITTVVKTVPTITQGKTVNTATTVNKAIVPSFVPKPVTKEKEKKTFSSAGYTGDDDINDVAAMGGVNLAEESQRILGSTEFVGTQIRSCKDEVFLHMTPLQQRIKQIVSNYGLEEPNQEVAALISHAAQERLKNLVEKLSVIAEHRADLIKVDPRYEVTQDVRAQLKFLEDLDKVERRRHEEQEREILLRAAKSRAKTEDPEQAKLKAKAKEMQRAEMEELRQREANLTALRAIGPRKKPRLDIGVSVNSPGSNSGLNASATGINRQMPMKPRLKKVNFRDLLFLLEQEKETCRSTMLYKSYLK